MIVLRSWFRTYQSEEVIKAVVRAFGEEEERETLISRLEAAIELDRIEAEEEEDILDE